MNHFPQPSVDPETCDFRQLDDLTLLACLVAGEARGESFEGKVAVAWVVRNRVAYPHPNRFGASWSDVILRPWQFSCFNADDPNRRLLTNPAAHFTADVWAECYKAAAGVFCNWVPDPTKGSDHYFNPRVADPDWAHGRSPVVTIGHHDFYKLT